METFFAAALGVAIASASIIYAAYAIVHTDWYVNRPTDVPLEALRLPGFALMRLCFGLPAALLIPLTSFSALGLIGAAHRMIQPREDNAQGYLAALGTDASLTCLLTLNSYTLIVFLATLGAPVLFYYRIHRARRLAMDLKRCGWGPLPSPPAGPPSSPAGPNLLERVRGWFRRWR